MTDDEEIIDELKKCYSPKDYELNNWEVILSRSVDVDESVKKYKTAFATIYLKNNKYYDVDPIEFGYGSSVYSYNDISEFNDDEQEIIDVLKSFYPPKDYELNDWKIILSKSTTDEDGITKYKTAFATIYLDKNNNYCDVEPIEIDKHRDLLTNKLNDSDLSKVDKIKQYVLPKHYDLINWNYVLNRVKKISDNLYLYPLGIMDLYLDDDLNVVNYDRCYIIDNEFWYDFNKHPLVAAERCTFITKLD